MLFFGVRRERKDTDTPMATILYADGRQQETSPRDGLAFQIDDLQMIVNGFIEIVPTRDGRILVINEEGKIEGLPRNEQATALVNFSSPAELAEMQEQYPFFVIVGDIGDEADYIVGDALLCNTDDVR